jgi:hypothetical protein
LLSLFERPCVTSYAHCIRPWVSVCGLCVSQAGHAPIVVAPSVLHSRLRSSGRSKKPRCILKSFRHGARLCATPVVEDQCALRPHDVGCDIGQGFVFAPALEASRLTDWTMQRNGRANPARKSGVRD